MTDTIVPHLTHSDNGMFATVPYSLDVNVLREVPNLFFRDERIVVCRVHNPRIVELEDEDVSLTST
jgi:hypothetical protein